MSHDLDQNRGLQQEADPLISIVVMCRNQREQAVAALRALQAQQEQYPQSEVILVDHGSLDNTRQVVIDRFPGVRVITAPEGLSRAKASGLGAVMANGHVVAVVDCAAPVEDGLFRRLADTYRRAFATAPQQLILSRSLVPGSMVQPAA